MKSTDVSTEIKHVQDLLRDLLNGRLRVPNFQRPFVWNHVQIRRLLDSIVNGYPIGSLFIWETSERYENLKRVGPVEVDIEKPPEPVPVGYLLDGHQRLTTLLGSLMATDDQVEKWKDQAFHIYFDLSKEEFVHTRQPQSRHFPVRRLSDTVNFLEECDRLRRELPNEAAPLINKAHRLVETFQRCTVAVTRVINRDMDDAIEAFTRLNTEGKKMTPEQVFSALSYKEGKFNLAQSIDELIEDVLGPLNYGEVNRTALLRVVLAGLEYDIYSRAFDWRKLLSEREEDLKQVMTICNDTLGKSVEFLHRQIGASSQKVLPYSLQLVLLNEFFRTNPSPDAAAMETMERWIWVSSFSGAFMVGSSGKFNDAVESARKLASTGRLEGIPLDVHALPMPTKFHAKAARVRAFFLFLKAQRPLDPSTGEPFNDLLDDGFRDAIPIFRANDPRQRHRIENRVLMNGGAGQLSPDELFKSLKDRAEGFRIRVLDSHSISNEAWRCLLDDNIQGFLDARRDRLIDDEIKFMKDKGVDPPRHPRDVEDWSTDTAEE